MRKTAALALALLFAVSLLLPVILAPVPPRVPLRVIEGVSTGGIRAGWTHAPEARVQWTLPPGATSP